MLTVKFPFSPLDSTCYLYANNIVLQFRWQKVMIIKTLYLFQNIPLHLVIILNLLWFCQEQRRTFRLAHFEKYILVGYFLKEDCPGSIFQTVSIFFS